MDASIEQIVRDRLNNLSGKEFQKVFWSILLASDYPDLSTPRMQSDLGNDGYSLEKREFFAVYGTEWVYKNKSTAKKISNPTPKKGEEKWDYEKFVENWADKWLFDTWIFVTKENLMWEPHIKITELNSNGDKIKKLQWWMEQIFNLCLKLKMEDLRRIFNISHLVYKSQSWEVYTIMDLIKYMSENAELTEDGIQNIMPDPDKKIEQRFAEYCQRIKNEILDSSMYAKAQKEAENAIGLDRITVQKKVSFLKAKSRFFLRENNNNPVLALDRMTDYLESELKASDRNYNYVAIRYYLISEIPKCNIFPNE